MILVDTSVWIDYFRDAETPEAQYLEFLLGRNVVGLVDLVLCELLRGVKTDAQARFMLSELKHAIPHQVSGTELAIKAAENFRTLRVHGFTIRSTIDCLIATYCIENEHTLLHRDRDFDAFEKHLGLMVVGRKQ
ncbi:MAG: PIN domain nuclease [Acidobacteria bacterium]|nr:PIN domain nuclease [Acidobacteriota bacterium]